MGVGEEPRSRPTLERALTVVGLRVGNSAAGNGGRKKEASNFLRFVDISGHWDASDDSSARAPGAWWGGSSEVGNIDVR